MLITGTLPDELKPPKPADPAAPAAASPPNTPLLGCARAPNVGALLFCDRLPKVGLVAFANLHRIATKIRGNGCLTLSSLSLPLSSSSTTNHELLSQFSTCSG